jgi:hypothetical protein
MQAMRREAAAERVRVQRSDKGVRTVRERGPAVSSQARRHLAECCAFFKAQRYRDAEPDKIRRHDIDAAEAEIGSIIRKFCSS